jgi:Bacterial Ig-like domain
MGTNAAPSADLEITFYENVRAGSGSIRLFRSNGTLVQAISINDPAVTISGKNVTIPIADLILSNSYYATIDNGAIFDLFGNAYSGISNTTTWSFTTAPGVIVTNFSNFSESGNLLRPSATDTREQSFTPSVSPAGSVTAAHVSGGNTGQETYLTDEFDTLTTGYRITVDLSAATFNSAVGAQTIGLAIASTETPTNRTNLLIWGWRLGSMYVATFNASGGNTSSLPAFPGAVRPDSVFIERTATGWTLGSTKSGIETISFANITTVGATAITANGEAFGLWSDMRLSGGTWTVTNLMITPPANTFANWIDKPSFGIAPADRGLLADPDHDSLSNGIEAWFGTHPGESSAGIETTSSSGTTITFTHPASANPPQDLTACYEWSPDLITWYSGDGVAGPAGGPTVRITSGTMAGTTTVTATRSAPGERLFLRAAVMAN